MNPSSPLDAPRTGASYRNEAAESGANAERHTGPERRSEFRRPGRVSKG